MMDAKVAGPVKRACLNLLWRALSEDLAHEFQRRNVSLRFVDGGHDAPASGAHRKDRQWAELTRAQMQLVCRKSLVRLNVRKRKRILVFRPRERHSQQMPNRAVSAVATDDEGSPELNRSAFVFSLDVYAIVLLLGGNEGGLILDDSALAPQLPGQQSLSHILRNHGNEP